MDSCSQLALRKCFPVVKSLKLYSHPGQHCSEHVSQEKNPPSLSAIYLPQLLQLVDLLGSNLTGSKLLLLRWDLHQPGEEAAVLDQWLPLRAVPVDILEATLAGTRLSALEIQGITKTSV